MKRIEAILRPESLTVVLEALKAAGSPGIMVSEIKGHGKQRGISQSWRGQKYRVDLLPKIKIDVVVSDKKVNAILKAIASVTQTGRIGDGKIFVTDVADALRIRTGERGDDALN